MVNREFKGKMWEYCDECGIYSVCNDENICRDCEQEAIDNGDEEESEE